MRFFQALWKFIEEYFAVQESVYVPSTQLSPIPEKIVNKIVNKEVTKDDPIFMEELHKNVTKEGLDWQPDWLDFLIDALSWVESREPPRLGDVNAIGDKNIPESKGGKAYGVLQIRGGVLGQVNALWGTKYKGTDLLGEKGAELSRKMCRDYFLKIAPQYRSYKKALKSGMSKEEVCAKSWNGGIGFFELQDNLGYETYKKNLDHYWALVQSRLIK